MTMLSFFRVRSALSSASGCSSFSSSASRVCRAVLAVPQVSASGLLVQTVVLNPRRQALCTAADVNIDDRGGQEENDKRERFRKNIDELRELKRQMEELDKKYDSYFTVDYALDLARKGFKDSDDDDFVDSSDSDRSSLEISGPSEGELSPTDDD